ncbi:MAG: Uncharacterised protein [Bacteroidetes bacterium MED-G17]|nr:MAG: Uncharacterised protein [Bacteroidetes bacterium MED-G17]
MVTIFYTNRWQQAKKLNLGFKPIKHRSKIVKVHKALVTPDFDNKTVLVRDHWDYVEMWLQKEKKKEALMYWRQAESFYKASTAVPKTASPLTLYYCFLNATKALLTVKGIAFVENHGARGKIQDGDTNLKNEEIKFHANGILSSLCGYFSEPCNNDIYSLKDLLYNLPYIHRCFNLTFPTGYPEIYIPINNPHFVIKDNSHKGWFYAELSGNYASKHSLNKIKSSGFEQDIGVKDRFVIRKKKRFDWYKSGEQKNHNIAKLTNYHKGLRKDLHYIHGPMTLWYVKRRDGNKCIARHPLTIMLACMHRLSELARYEPAVVFRHFELKQNWLLSEFIKGSGLEFVDKIACEITNQNLMIPAVRTIK